MNTVSTPQPNKNEDFGDYTYINDMPSYVSKNTQRYTQQRKVMSDTLVVFDGVVMSLPKAQKTAVLQEAIEISKITPKPMVNDAMFVKVGQQTNGDDCVIPVYVDKSILFDQINNDVIRLNQRMRFAGFHIYNYSKGPAIVVESAVLLTR